MTVGRFDETGGVPKSTEGARYGVCSTGRTVMTLEVGQSLVKFKSESNISPQTSGKVTVKKKAFYLS